ncbi:LysR family transcriptional regulator [Caldimonas brevitalea]|uniref:LysR family transcriptional regulator n=1 Tax=Caldimonas brevitalea TaxID=413882 RepID=A0A0G3BXT0_9BURK|nr:LysR family transcriptional regulator [Caldimonas brevitalea]AKJ32201.1 LysR family transcriptional regulator [Caldimonas brevitalea]
MDRLDTLRVFVAVAEQAGFAAAARHLRLSAPAVTRAVVALEQRVGARLLHRTTRSVRLTEAGERYLADCKRILQDLEEADAAAGGDYAEPQGWLAVTASSMFGRLHVAPLLLDFLAAYPKVNVRSLFVDRVVNLVDEGLDVAVRIARLPDSSLTAVRVGSVRAVVVASPDYLGRRGIPAVPADLQGHHAIGIAQTGGRAAPWRFGRDATAAEPAVRLVVNSGDVAIGAALAGHGLARALSYQVAADVVAGRLQIVLAEHEPPPTPVHLVYPEGRKAAAKVRAFVDFAAPRLRERLQLAAPEPMPAAAEAEGR